MPHALMNKALIDAAVLLPSVGATTKEGVLEEMLGGMADAGVIATSAVKPVLVQLLEREAQGSTGLGNGVAIPHVRETDGISDTVIALGIAGDGVAFDAIDGRAVRIVFLILGPAGVDPDEHLQVLRWVSRLARNLDFRRFVLTAGSAQELVELLREMTEAA